MPLYGPPIPWEKTTLTPNIGVLDSTPDVRPGLGFAGVEHLRTFVEAGGLLITSQNTAGFAIDEGLAPGVFVAPKKSLRIVGSVLDAVVVDKNAPSQLWLRAPQIFEVLQVEGSTDSDDGGGVTVSDLVNHHEIPTAKEYKRPTGRGGPDDEDTPEGRGVREAAPLPSPKTWEATPLNEEQARNNPYLIPDPTARTYCSLCRRQIAAAVRFARKLRRHRRACRRSSGTPGQRPRASVCE